MIEQALFLSAGFVAAWALAWGLVTLVEFFINVAGR